LGRQTGGLVGPMAGSQAKPAGATGCGAEWHASDAQPSMPMRSRGQLVQGQVRGCRSTRPRARGRAARRRKRQLALCHGHGSCCARRPLQHVQVAAVCCQLCTSARPRGMAGPGPAATAARRGGRLLLHACTSARSQGTAAAGPAATAARPGGRLVPPCGTSTRSTGTGGCCARSHCSTSRWPRFCCLAARHLVPRAWRRPGPAATAARPRWPRSAATLHADSSTGTAACCGSQPPQHVQVAAALLPQLHVCLVPWARRVLGPQPPQHVQLAASCCPRCTCPRSSGQGGAAPRSHRSTSKVAALCCRDCTSALTKGRAAAGARSHCSTSKWPPRAATSARVRAAGPGGSCARQPPQHVQVARRVEVDAPGLAGGAWTARVPLPRWAASRRSVNSPRRQASWTLHRAARRRRRFQPRASAAAWAQRARLARRPRPPRAAEQADGHDLLGQRRALEDARQAAASCIAPVAAARRCAAAHEPRAPARTAWWTVPYGGHDKGCGLEEGRRRSGTRSTVSLALIVRAYVVCADRLC